MALTASHLMEPEQVLHWAMQTWGEELAFTTGLGPGGIALLHMARKLRRVRCIFLDTGFHFAATLQYAEDIAARGCGHRAHAPAALRTHLARGPSGLL